MNLGQAVAVCLYELVRDPKTPRLHEKLPPAAADEVERITTMLLDALHLSGFLELRRVADADQRIRRLVRRLESARPRRRHLAGHAAPNRLEDALRRRPENLGRRVATSRLRVSSCAALLIQSPGRELT